MYLKVLPLSMHHKVWDLKRRDGKADKGKASRQFPPDV